MTNTGDGQAAGTENASAEQATAADQQRKEDELFATIDQTAEEMRDVMATMMDASTKMMKAFIDMRLSYLKMMRAGLEDPQVSIDAMVKSTSELAKAAKNIGRK